MRNTAARSNLLVPEIREVMDIRQASGYLGIYRRDVQAMATGAVLTDLGETSA